MTILKDENASAEATFTLPETARFETHDAGVQVEVNRDDLIRRFEAIGYEMVDGWRSTDSSLFIPCYPDRSVRSYSGMFFRLSDGDVQNRMSYLAHK